MIHKGARTIRHPIRDADRPGLPVAFGLLTLSAAAAPQNTPRMSTGRGTVVPVTTQIATA
jgi:hypothetical protein